MRGKVTGICSLVGLHRRIYCYSTHYIHRQRHFLFVHQPTSTLNGFNTKIPFEHLLCSMSSSKFSTSVACFASSIDGKLSDVESEIESDPDENEVNDYKSQLDQRFSTSRDLETILDILQTGSVQEKRISLEKCGVKATQDLVGNIISRTRNDWETAFTFFLWAGKQSNYEHSVRDYHSMIAILGKFRKYDTAWSLIDDMRAASLVTPQTLLIMIRKYAAAHDVAKAISTFYSHKRFKLEKGMEEFQGMLSALCRYKNVKDAEHLLFCNKTVFPFNTKSFNIILNGWCNVIGSQREGDRIWREMDERCIKQDVYSFASIMSCQSKAGNLTKVLKLFDKMQVLGIEPDRKVYNAVIHALAKGKLVKRACSLMKTMEDRGLKLDAVTYNSLIIPLCKYRYADDANQSFEEMVKRGICPTVRSYHAFFRMLRTGEEVFALLQKMKDTECHPSHDTYIMLIRKFCRWGQLDNVSKLWTEMRVNGLDPDRSSYIVLIHGLFLNGKLEEAHKYYLEMKKKHLLPEPKIDEMMQVWLAGKVDSEGQSTNFKDNKFNCSRIIRKESTRNLKENNFFRKPEQRKVIRERGFSFLDNED